MSEFESPRRGSERVETVDATDIVDADGIRVTDTDADKRLRLLSHVLYGLYAVSWFTGGVTGLIAVIIDYVKRGDAHGTYYASHATWRIRTFWGGLLFSMIAAPFVLIHIGMFFFILIWIWLLYRVIKGWLFLLDRKSMYRK